LQLAALSLGDLLSQRLSSLPGVTLRSSDAAARARLAASGPAELAQHAGVELLLSGSIERSSQSGNGRVELTLFDLRAGAPNRRWVPWHYDLPLLAQASDLAGIQRATEVIAQRVADELRLDLDPGRAAQSTPRDLRAYRLFLLAFGREAEVSCLGTGAAQLLRDSLALDPSYPPA
ncbi:MAG: hypothetical protein K8H90_05855, partial [Thermoanaerobaculia bacterium]|nr:hypothetical protein [Thermoanaerobaculia bacterium]